MLLDLLFSLSQHAGVNQVLTQCAGVNQVLYNTLESIKCMAAGVYAKGRIGGPRNRLIDFLTMMIIRFILRFCLRPRCHLPTRRQRLRTVFCSVQDMF